MEKAPVKRPKPAPKSAAPIEKAVIDDMAPPTRAHAKATKEQFEAADAAARRAVSGF